MINELRHGDLEEVLNILNVHPTPLKHIEIEAVLARLTKEIIELKKRPSGTQLSLRQQINSLGPL